MLDRSNEDVLELCRERGLAFVPFFPLGSAFTGGPQRLAEDPAIAADRRQARRHALAGRPRLAAAPRRAHPAHPRDLIGAHLEENLAAADVDLDADDMTALETSGRPGSPLEAVHE